MSKIDLIIKGNGKIEVIENVVEFTQTVKDGFITFKIATFKNQLVKSERAYSLESYQGFTARSTMI